MTKSAVALIGSNWIAGLSIVNSILYLNDVYFIVGLAISLVVVGYIYDLTGSQNFVWSLITPLMFALLGYFAAKPQRWAFIIGALIYLGDGLLYLYFEEWLAAGFHAFVLYNLFVGFREISEYEKLTRSEFGQNGGK